MEGNVKKWTSIFRGYQDRWVVLTNDGYLKYYETQPEDPTEDPRAQIHLSLAEIERRNDHRFKVTSNDGHKFHFKAENDEEAEKWLTTMVTIQSSLEDSDELDSGKKSEEDEEEDEEETKDIPGPLTEDDGKDGSKSQQDVTNSLKPRKHNSLKDVAKAIMTADDITAEFRRLMIENKRKNFKVVAAIDFGSSCTGCAYSFKKEYEKDPIKIHTVALSDTSTRSKREPTVLLLNQDGLFDSFGFKAEEQYTAIEQADKEAAKNWYYLQRFKTQLYNDKNLSKFLQVTDIGGKSVKTVEVFAMCIEHLRDIVYRKIKEEKDVAEYEVRWVLTCPAMWNESARQFLIDAGEKGGIDRRNITLALEPEAAAICCKSLETKGEFGESKGSASLFSTGARFLIIDLGGETVDITANEVLETGQLREIYNASGGRWGGHTINHKIWILIHDVFGNAVVQNFMNEFRDDYLGMVRDVEEKKQNVDFDSKFTIDIPDTLLAEANRLKAEMVYEKNKELVKLVKSKLVIEPEIIHNIFKDCIDTLCRHVSHLLSKDETKGVESILLVGGYSSCDLLRKTIKKTFQQLQLLCPSDPDTIVLKGAVIMGHMNTPIAKRIARYHYGMAIDPGVELAQSFDGSIHKHFETESEFYVFIKKGSPIKVNDVIAEYDVPVNPNQDKVVIEVFASDLEIPPAVVSEDFCRKIGTIRIKIGGINKGYMLKVGISCDGTEFKAVARDLETGRCFAGVCRFLE